MTKKCFSCRKVKNTTEYHKSRDGKYGVRGSCKECVNEKARIYRENNPEKVSETYERFKRKAAIESSENYSDKEVSLCTKCGKYKPNTCFYKNKYRKEGVAAHCKECKSAYYKELRKDPTEDVNAYHREWRAENKDKVKRYHRKYVKRNSERVNLLTSRRRARIRNLRDDLTIEHQDNILEEFNNKCSLCRSVNLNMDHFIPIATGHGGTHKGNIVPLCEHHNKTKQAKNPFEWADTLSEEQHANFTKVVEYLAELNGLTVDEYREFVFWCFENPRDDVDISEENRDSLSVWLREKGVA